MIAADVMTENPRTIRVDDTVGEAVDALQTMDVRHLPVVNEAGELVGILSDRDLGALFGPFAEGAEAGATAAVRAGTPVASIMRGDVVSVLADSDIKEVIDAMLEHKIGAVPVVDGEGRLEGIISYVDILRALSPAEPSTRPRARRKK